MLTVYADGNFRNATTTERDSDRIQLEAVVRAETNGTGTFGHCTRATSSAWATRAARAAMPT